MIEYINKVDYVISEWVANNLRSNIFDVIFRVITELGDIYFFILILMVLYWVVDKRFAYKFFFAFLLSAIANSILKIIIKRPRPYHKGIPAVGGYTSGYSMPSGHSQATGVIYYTFRYRYGYKYKILNHILIGFLILVPFSRIYLGQHYLTDVVIGTLIGILVASLGFKIFDKMGDKEHLYPLLLIPVIVLLGIIFFNNDYSNFKQIYVAGGGYIGFTVGYYLEKTYINHNVDVSLNIKIKKLIMGILIIVGSYLIISLIFKSINDQSLILDFLRYLILALEGSLLIPYLFTKVFKE